MTKALPAGRPIKHRPVFGLFDPDGWAWATVKAGFWLFVIIITLGYIPDRAYYFIVSRTFDIIGTPGLSIVNLCPPENGSTMPCPVPAGSVLPWQASPPEISLPQPRTGGAAAQIGTTLLYIGGTDGKAASATTYIATLDKGTFGAWTEGPALPAARTDAGMAVLNGTAFLAGGLGPDGAPTATLYSLAIDPTTTKLGNWAVVDKVQLPAPRSGASVVAVPDGIVVLGGRGPDGKVTSTVWKATLDSTSGKLGAFKDQPGLPHPVADAAAAYAGTWVWVYGGSDEAGPTAAVQRADYGAVTAPAAGGAASAAPASPAASGATTQGVIAWAVPTAAAGGSNLPAPRTGGAGFVSNGALYLAGGSDGTTAHGELYWAVPDNSGNIAGWQHLAATDLPAAVAHAAPVVTGGYAILIGGTSASGVVATSSRASMAPQAPFFQAGLVGFLPGVVVPGLQIGGQIGTQLGLLAAAGVGTGNFAILVALGWAFNHKPQIAAWRDRRRRAREARAPKPV
ncbi:MAG TPA: kelch repeat-containing protein [Candidatus Dormibacteraeota bacterium]|nr:kelch repeat-containing protein [Candidatus Dormibacteraeota bacterium]